MLKTLEGVYRNGKIELVEQSGDIADETRVLVTILQLPVVDLAAYGIDQAQAADLRGRLARFGEDWEQPDMGQRAARSEPCENSHTCGGSEPGENP